MTLSVPDFSPGRVLVVGDVMLDRYWHGATSRISPEAPVPVVHVGETEDRIGGAGNVGMNIAALDARVTVMGLVGRDAAAEDLRALLAASRCRAELVEIDDAPTIIKLRVISQHQQLIRLDFEQRFTGVHQQALQQPLEQALREADVLVLSDYAKGALSDPRPFIRAARALGKPVLVDPKRDDLGAYAGATLLTPNFKEFEAVVGKCAGEGEIRERGARLLEQHDFQALLITRGEHGMTLLRREHSPLDLPAKAREVFDVTGAGDTVVAVLAAGLAAGQDLEQAARLANTAAGIVVGKMGTATVTVPELEQALALRPTLHTGVVTEDELLELVASARRQGERVIMTNGCFDILHPGHLSYLKQAAALGDRLIVAVNDDASVARLKGPSRPLNGLQDRMAMLAGLGAVDWVLPFSEDTPERLICRVLPDLLVKGGDYRPEQVAGGECVAAAGGEVRILPFLSGHSTSALIGKIRGQQG